MSDHDAKENLNSSPQLLTPDDIALLKTIRPQMSSNGGRFIDLIFKVFDTEDTGALNLSGLLNDLGSAGNPSMNMLYALNMLMSGPYKPK